MFCENVLDEIYGPVNLSEFNKLVELVKAEGIPYETRSRLGGMQMMIPTIDAYVNETDERRISIVLFNGCYGGENGLMKIFAPGLNKGVEGFLNAEQALDYIKDTRAGISRGSIG